MASAVGNGQERNWRDPSSLARDNVSYPTYISGLSSAEVRDRTGIVAEGAFKGAIMGTGVGAVIGVFAGGPIGAGIGAGAGAGGGAIAGALYTVASLSAYDYSEFKKYRASLSETAKKEINKLLSEHQNEENFICCISKEFLIQPVCIRGEADIYEHSVLECIIKKQGKSPSSRKVITKSDIVVSIAGVAALGKICDNVLNDPQKRMKHSDNVLKGMAILRKEAIKTSCRIHDKEMDRLVKERKSGKISIEAFTNRIRNLGELLNPILGDKAIENRVDYRDRDDEKE